MLNSPLTRTAPGRVNLIGEHTDYTGGFVFPIAIPFATHATIEPRTDGLYEFRSREFAAEPQVMSADDRSQASGRWSDYAVGVLREFQKLGWEVPGFTLTLEGNVPVGAGLSSSASIEVATCMALLALTGRTMEAKDVAQLCQRAENLYVGSPCGIMDQFASAAAHKGHAFLLNTRDLSYEHIPLSGELHKLKLIVCNSGVKHSIADGEYGTRRRQLEEGQAVITAKFGTRDLGDSTLQQLEACKFSMSPESYKRCRHIISENGRVLEARQAMIDGDVARLSKLMLAAHISQRDDFECSCEEIDFLVDTALATPGGVASRLTGGGFGGCTINFVEPNAVDSWKATMSAAYRAQFGLEAAFYEVEPTSGALELAEEIAPVAQEAR